MRICNRHVEVQHHNAHVAFNAITRCDQRNKEKYNGDDFVNSLQKYCEYQDMGVEQRFNCAKIELRKWNFVHHSPKKCIGRLSNTTRLS